MSLLKKALDRVTLTVERKIAIAWLLAVGLGRNHRRDVAAHECMKLSASDAFAKHRPGIDSVQQWLLANEVVSLAWREHHIDRIAQRIDQGMDFS